MEKMVIISGKNKVNVDTGLTGNGTNENPLQYTGEIQHSDKRSLLWESTANDYNTTIQLSEPITHFDQVMIYGSGLENGDTMHLSKNVYIVQPGVVNGCDISDYSVWALTYQCNYILGARLRLSGNTGYIGSSYYWGIGQNNASWAAGKWTGTEAPKMLMPWKIFGIGRHPTYNFFGLDSEGGTVSANLESGYSGDTATLTAIPESEVWKCSAIDITGATLTGNDFMFGNSNVTASAGFEHSRDLTLENGDHGVLSADKMTGFSGDVVTVDATTDEGWYLSAIALTGAEATGFKFMFTGSDVTAQGEYTDVGFPVTYLSDEHVSVTGDTTIYIPGSEGIPLQSSYDTYYRISGYDIENGEINENGLLVPTGPCTIRAVEKVNYFTATGNFEKGSNVNANGDNAGNIGVYQTKWVYSNVPEKYALLVNYTGDISTSWYKTSNRWNPSDASAYSITLNAIFKFTANSNGSSPQGRAATAVTMLGSTANSQQTFSRSDGVGSNTWNYNKTVTTTKQNILYGISGRVGGSEFMNGMYVISTTNATYIATGTTGTWTATGIAP